MARYIKDRVYLHQLAGHRARNGRALPECTAEERWERPSKFAVRKPGRKTALRVFDDLVQAQDLAAQTPSGYVEHRPGASVRCEGYCPVAQFCAQWQKIAAQSQHEAA